MSWSISSIEDPQSNLKKNASEVALLQRLLFPELPIKSNGELLGPKKVCLKILFIIETWISTQLEKDLSSLKIDVNNEESVLGFVGAPWTLAAYVVEGKSSKIYWFLKISEPPC